MLVERRSVVILKRIIITVALLIYTVIIFLPPIMHGYVYPNNGDDFAQHVKVIEGIRDGTEQGVNYWGQYIVGYPLIWMSNLTNISIVRLFFWFNYIVLWLVGMSCFLLFRKIDWKTGLLSIAVVVFCGTTVMNLFDTGAIYDLATVGIFVPLVLLAIGNMIESKKKGWLFFIIPFVILAFLFHSMVVFKFGIGTGIAVMEPFPSVDEFVIRLIGYNVLIVLGLSSGYAVYKNLKFTKWVRFIFISLLLGGIGIFALSFLVSYPYRLMLDLAIIIMMISCSVFGMAYKSISNKWASIVISVLIMIASVPMVVGYTRYNSAIKEIDTEVIEYVNGLEGDYFSCSPEVAAWIYDIYINKTYKEGELPYIQRSEPMTYKTRSDTLYYWWKDKESIKYDFSSAVKFSDDGIEIYVLR